MTDKGPPEIQLIRWKDLQRTKGGRQGLSIRREKERNVKAGVNGKSSGGTWTALWGTAGLGRLLPDRGSNLGLGGRGEGVDERSVQGGRESTATLG